MYTYTINSHSDGMYSYSIKKDGIYILPNGERVEWYSNKDVCEEYVKLKIKELCNML